MISLLGGLVLAGIGVLIVLQALRDIRAGRATGRWLRTPAVLTRFEVEKSRSFYGYRYRPIVAYKYSVAGREYIGDRAFAGDWNSWQSPSLESEGLAKLVVGATTEVAYNPERPEESVLRPGESASSLRYFAFGLLFIAFGCAGALRFVLR